MKKPEDGKKWKKAAIITVLMGTAMSALGGMAVLSGVLAAFCKNEKINKIIFFILSFIIISKTIIVEALRIANYFAG